LASEVHSAAEAFRSRGPFPSWTTTKCSKTASSLGVKWASLGRGAVPYHRHQAWPGPSHGEIGRGDSTRVSQLKLRGKAIEPAQNPLIQITIEVCDHAKGGSLFESGCKGNPSSCGGPCHWSVLEKCKAPTNMQPCLQAGSISNPLQKMFKTMYIVHARAACQGLKSASL
jgi:hypothetical protein